MVTLRFARHGTKKRPYYHIVVADHEKPRDGRFIEQVGTYDPKKPMADARVDRARVDYWLGVGAQPSTACAKLFREHEKALAAVRK